MPNGARQAVSFKDVTLGYHRHPAVHHLTGSLDKGALTAIIGANGSGKSTLMKGITGMLKPMSGEIHIAPGETIAYLPQQSELDRHFPARVVDLVAMGLWNKRGLIGRHTGADRARIVAALETVGLSGFERRGIDTLSGGQLQRVLFARVLVQDASLILLDEPFSAIDAKTLSDLVDLITRWQEEGRTVAVVVHDLDLVRAHFPMAMLLARRLVAWDETRKVLAPRNLEQARDFQETWDEAAPWCHDDDHDPQGGIPHQHGADAEADRIAGNAP
ncbi:MAG: ABC transporter ATP-binding protein [Alphaproteobacteria bacterium]|nr:ABC transporter ATP-binding protein [Alphaproteobacteria bacterium]